MYKILSTKPRKEILKGEARRRIRSFMGFRDNHFIGDLLTGQL